MIPLPHSAVIGCCDNKTGFCGKNRVDSICMSYQRKYELALLIPGKNKSILVACVDLVHLKAKAADEFLVFLSLLSTWSAQNFLGRIVTYLILMIPVLE